MSSRTIELSRERDGAVACVTLQRPQVHDAFDEAMIRELTEAFTSLSTEPGVRVVVLRSLGKSFCAGADLEWMRRMSVQSAADNLADAGRLEDMFRAIATCARPVVARVQGVAFGGGAGLVCACDLAIASTHAKLAFTEVRLGILPAVISPYVLRKMPPGRAQALFLTAEPTDARHALELGLVHRVVEPDALDAAIDAVLDDLLKGGPSALSGVKRLVADVAGRSLDDARAVTTQAIAEARAGEEGREGIAAFLEKRPPGWT